MILSTLLIQYYGWTGFDPIASLFIAVLIAASVIPLVIDTGKVLMLDLSEHSPSIEGALTEVCHVSLSFACELDALFVQLHHIEGLEAHTSARFWPKDDNSIIGSVHVKIAPSASSFDPGGPHSTVHGRYTQVDRVVERVDTLLRSRVTGLEELAIQVEAGGETSFAMEPFIVVHSQGL